MNIHSALIYVTICLETEWRHIANAHCLSHSDSKVRDPAFMSHPFILYMIYFIKFHEHSGRNYEAEKYVTKDISNSPRKTDLTVLKIASVMGFIVNLHASERFRYNITTVGDPRSRTSAVMVSTKLFRVIFVSTKQSVKSILCTYN